MMMPGRSGDIYCLIVYDKYGCIGGRHAWTGNPVGPTPGKPGGLSTAN